MKPELLLSVDSERRFWLDPRTKLYMLVIFSIVMIDGKTDGITDASLFNGQFILDVQGCRGLIQQQDRTVFQNSPGDREALPLTTGEQVAVLAGGVS